jgi:hypothetical protein
VINQLRLLGNKLLRRYEVGQVWVDVFTGKVIIIEVYPSGIVTQSEHTKSYMTKDMADNCLRWW